MNRYRKARAFMERTAEAISRAIPPAPSIIKFLGFICFLSAHSALRETPGLSRSPSARYFFLARRLVTVRATILRSGDVLKRLTAKYNKVSVSPWNYQIEAL